MIFELLDGRNLLYQWDLNRKITVNDESIKEVHFCNRTGDCSLVVEVVDGLANIPNILLQSSFDIRVYGYDGEATLHEEVFKVKARTRPADYVYTETEILTVEQLAEDLRNEIDERITAVEEGLITDGFATKEYVDEAIKPSIYYLDFTGIKFGDVAPIEAQEAANRLRAGETLSIYITDKAAKSVELLNGYIACNVNVDDTTIRFTIHNLNGLAIVSGISEQFSHNYYLSFKEETNLWTFGHDFTSTEYPTKEYVNEVVSNVSADLSGYAKESYVDEAIAQSVSGLASKEHTHDEYAKKNHTHNEYANTNHTHTGYAKANHTHSMADVDGLQLAISERATQEDIDKAIELHNHNDLYAAKEHNHDEKYSTKGHVHSYNDLTNRPEIPSIEGLATESYVDNAIANIEIPEGEENNVVLIKRTSTDGNKIQSILDEGKWPVLHTGAVLMPYESKIIRNNSGGTLKTINYYFGRTNNGDYSSTYYDTETSTWSSFSNISLASKDYVDEAISNIEIPEGGDVDLSNYYTKEEVDDAIANIEIPDDTEVIELNLGADTKSVYVSSGIASKIAANPEKCIIKLSQQNIEATYFRCNRHYYSESANFSITKYSAVSTTLTDGNISPAVLVINISTYDSDGKPGYTTASLYTTVLKDGQTINIDNYYTKEEVDEAIANAGGSGGGGSAEGAVSYLEAQDLTTEQKNQAKANLELPYTEITPTTYFTNQSASAISAQRSAYIYASNQPSIKDLANAAIGTTFSITVKNSSSNPTLTETVECIKTKLSLYSVLTDTTNFLYLSNDDGSISTSGMDVMKKTGTDGTGYGSTVYVDLVVNAPSGVNKLSEDLIDSTLLSGITFDNSSDYQMTFVTKSKSSSYTIPSGNISIGNQNNIPGGNNSYYFGNNNKGVQNNYPNFLIGNYNRTGYYEYGEYASGSAPAKNMFMFGSYLKPSQNSRPASVVVGSYNEKTSKYIPYNSSTTYNTGDCVTTSQTNYSSAVYRCLQDGVKGKSTPSGTSSNDYWEYVDNGQSSEYVFTVGNGVSGVRSNAFTVDALGNVVAAGTVSPTGADYAEYFEFEDGNANNEDRMGLLVELVDDKIKLANGTDILGATSASKGVIGDAEEMNWHGKYERDELGRLVFEEVEVEREVINEETGETEIIKELVTVKKISKDYDPNRTYQPRSSRKEWYPVGLLGKVLVRQDGSLSAGDYVKAINGIATKSEEKTNIRVLEVMSEGIVRVLVK